jgi:hypothetical protein
VESVHRRGGNRALARRRWWLVKAVQAGQQEEAAQIVRSALDALVILRPVDVDGYIVFCESGSGRPDPRGFHKFESFKTTKWARCTCLHGLNMNDLALCHEAVCQAFEKGAARLINPIRLLEHGLQGTEMHIRVLLWAIALDALLIAHNGKTFERRLCNLLGPNTHVFPEDDLGRQPAYRVEEVAGNLYELRNVIAHGNEVPQKFRKPVGFKASGPPLGGNIAQCQVRELLHECALFLLCGVLKKILLSNWVPIVGMTKTWREHLDTLRT